MSTNLVHNLQPCEVGNSDAYNQLQFRCVMESRYERTGEISSGLAEKSLRVLVVDDHRDGAKIMSMLVNMWGHHCERTYDGVTGLELAAEYRPDVIILDIMMPNMSGVELATQLRQQARFRDTLIVAMTGCTDSGPRLRSEQAGVDLFLVKPVSPSILKTLLIMESAHRARSSHTKALKSVVATWLPEPRKLKSRLATQWPRRLTHVALAT